MLWEDPTFPTNNEPVVGRFVAVVGAGAWVSGGLFDVCVAVGDTSKFDGVGASVLDGVAAIGNAVAGTCGVKL